LAQLNFKQAEAKLSAILEPRLGATAQFAAHAAIWLEACDYPGLKTLHEALAEGTPDFKLQRTESGIDLDHASCVFIGKQILQDVLDHGRVPLRNVRHGLFLVPASVDHGLSIGCAIDASFAFGGPRKQNPYVEKLAMAGEAGVHLDAMLWQKLVGQD
jgi:hypothetical protein